MGQLLPRERLVPGQPQFVQQRQARLQVAEGMAAIERVAPDHVENVRRHFIDRLSPRQLEETRDAFAPIVEYLRKIRDRD